MTRVLLDTNVIVDFVLSRPGFAEHADVIFRKIEAKKVFGFISASAITDLYFIVEHATNEENARKATQKIYHSLRILAVDTRMIQKALYSNMKDFEDAVQTEAAKTRGIDIVVTRDKTGFTDSGLTVLSPTEFVEQLETKS